MYWLFFTWNLQETAMKLQYIARCKFNGKLTAILWVALEVEGFQLHSVWESQNFFGNKEKSESSENILSSTWNSNPRPFESWHLMLYSLRGRPKKGRGKVPP